jgi:L-fucose mutarotase
LLSQINPLLTGELLAHLDAMGHSDGVVLVDAHFPAQRLADRCLVMPGIGTPELLAAVRSVVPPDDAPALDLMRSADGTLLPVQRELVRAARVDEARVRHLERFEFYEAAGSAYLVVRTGETRTYGNALLRKGVVTAEEHRT